MSALAHCLERVRTATRGEFALPDSAEDRLIQSAQDKLRALNRKRTSPMNEVRAAQAVVQSFLDATQQEIARVVADEKAAQSSPKTGSNRGETAATPAKEAESGKKPAASPHRASIDAAIQTSVPRSRHAKAKTVADHVAPLLEAFAKLFKGVRFTTLPSGSGFRVLEDQTLLVDVARLTESMPDQSSGEWIRAAFQEEIIHRAALDVITRERAEAFWKKLGTTPQGQNLQDTVLRSYHAALEQAGKPIPDAADVSAWQMTHELVRMMVQDKAFAKQVTEAMEVTPGLKNDLAEFLRAIVDWLRSAIAKLPADVKAEAEAMQQQVIAKLRELGVPLEAETAPAAQEAKQPELAPQPRDITRAEVPKERKFELSQKAVKEEVDRALEAVQGNTLLKALKARHIYLPPKDKRGAEWNWLHSIEDRAKGDRQLHPLYKWLKTHVFTDDPSAPTLDRIAASLEGEAFGGNAQQTREKSQEQGTLIGDTLGERILAEWAGLESLMAQQEGEVQRLNAQERQAYDFGKDVLTPHTGTMAVPAADLKNGDTLKAQGVRMRVRVTHDEDGHTTGITVHDITLTGDQYGVQPIQDSATLYVESVEHAPRPSTSPRVEDNVDAPFSGERPKPESVVARLRREQEGLAAAERPVPASTLRAIQPVYTAALKDLDSTDLAITPRTGTSLEGAFSAVSPNAPSYFKYGDMFHGRLSSESAGTEDVPRGTVFELVHEENPGRALIETPVVDSADVQRVLGSLKDTLTSDREAIQDELGTSEREASQAGIDARMTPAARLATARDISKAASVDGRNAVVQAARSFDPRQGLSFLTTARIAAASTLTGVEADAHAAATSPLNALPQPTDGQKIAANYVMGHTTIGGLDITIENPAGSTRSGTSASGKPWSVTMKSHYGYFKGTVGKDGDHIDAFIKVGTPHDYNGPVFVVNQTKADGSFDEHKAVVGVSTPEEAKAEYLQNYSPGWKGLGSLAKFPSVEAFGKWATARRRIAEAKDQGLNSSARPYTLPDLVRDVRAGRTDGPLKAVNEAVANSHALMERRRAESERRAEPRRRGKLAIIENITRAANGERISSETAQVLTDFVNRLEDRFVNHDALSLRKGNTGGYYEFGEKIVTLLTESRDTARTGVHEFFHSLSRLIPDAEIANLRAEYAKALVAHLQKHPEFYALVGRDALTPTQFAEYKFFADAKADANTSPIINRDGTTAGYRIRFTRENYRLKSLDEWVAENLTDAFFADRYEPSVAGVWQRFVAFIRDLFRKLRQAMGLEKYRAFVSDVFEHPERLDFHRDAPLAPEVPLYQPNTVAPSQRRSLTDEGLDAGERPGVDPDLRAGLDLLAEQIPAAQLRADARNSGSWFEDAIEYDSEEAQSVKQRGLLDMAYHERRVSQTHDEWNSKAHAALEHDRDGVLKSLVDDVLSHGLITNPVKVKAAQMLIPDLFRRAIASGDKQAMKDAQAIAWGYDIAGTENARALAARWQPHKTSAEAHREMLAKMIFTPPPAQRAEIEAAPTPAQKAKRIADLEAELAKVQADFNALAKVTTDAAADRQSKARAAQAEMDTLKAQLAAARAEKDRLERLAEVNGERMARIEEELGNLGITLHDLFVSKEVIVRLRGSALVKRALEAFSEAERRAIKLMFDGKSDRQISNDLGMKRDEVNKLQARAEASMLDVFTGWTKKGFSLSDMESLDSAGNRVDLSTVMNEDGSLKAAARATVADPLALDRAKEMLRAIMPTAKARNTGALRRFTGDPKASPFGFDPAKPYHAVAVARLIQSVDNNVMDMVYEYWINGLLSGPVTHVANIAGNAAQMGLEYTLQRGLEATANLFLNDAALATFGEFSAMRKAAGWAFTDALRAMRQAWRTEADLFESEWLNQPVSFGHAPDKAGGARYSIPGATGRFIRIPCRALLAMDAFFKHLIGRLEASAQAYRIASSEGRTGADRENRIRGLVNTPGSASWVMAVRQAKELTFQQELPSFLKSLERMKNERSKGAGGAIVKTILKLIFPFIRTPWNIFAVGLRKTPLGSLNVAARAGTALYQMRKGRPFLDSYPKAMLVKHLVEQFMGWAGFAMLYGLSEGDPDDDKKWLLLTGTRSADDRAGEKKMLERTRGGQTMVLVNGQPVFNYGRIEPFATIITTMVDSMRAIKKVGRGARATDMAAAIIGNIKDQTESKTFFQGLDNLFTAFDQLRDPDKAGKKLAEAVIKGVVPNIIRQPLRNMDDYARDTKNAPMIYSAFPMGGLAEPLYDLYGRQVEKTGTPLSRLFLASGTKVPGREQVGDAALNHYNTANPLEAYYPGPDLINRYKDAGGKWHDMTPEEMALQRREGGKRLAEKVAATVSPAEARVPTAATKDKIEAARRTAFRETRDRMFQSGARPFIPRRPVSLEEMIFGRKN